MKKKILFLMIFFFTLLLVGCGKYGEDDAIKDFKKKIDKADSYRVTGTLEITNNDDTYQYTVDASYKKDNNYRVSLINKSNNHEQIILKNSDGVYVVTPSLNKSFKFQSDWPKNNSQIYLLSSILNDIKNDTERKFEEKDGNYIFTTKVNYPNNTELSKQVITLDNKLNLKTIEVQNNNGITQMTMKFDNIDYNSNFNSNYFDLNSIIDNIENPDDKLKNNTKDNNYNNQTTKDKNTTTENNNNNNINDKAPDNNKDKTTEQSSAIDDIIYPLYIPTGTSLIDKEKVSKTDGERVILTFDGEKPFLLVEETSSVSDEFSIVPTLGEPYLLIDTIGALTNNSITWSSNGIDYYIVSDAMSQIELIEIASSISSIPTMK